MEHVHGGNCGCADELKNSLDLYDLNENISARSISVLNEKHPKSGKNTIICGYHNRNGNQFCTSDDDDELIYNLYFIEEVKIKALIVSSRIQSLAPKTIKIYCNPSTPLDFSNAEDYKPTMQFQCHYDPTGEKPMFVRGSIFNKVNHVSVHISNKLCPTAPRTPEDVALLNENSLSPTHDQMGINYLGFIGNYTGVHRGAIKDLSYEIVPQSGDHMKNEQMSSNNTAYGL